MTARKPGTPVGPSAEADTAFRSSAVARMAGMPVATLRIWEQRYRAVQPGTSPTGHRRYSPADVQRVILLRDLTARGHAIGSIAPLDSVRLQQLHQSVAVPTRAPADATRELRIIVVGPALALRLQRPGVVRCLHRAPRVIAVFDTLGDVASDAGNRRADLLMCHAPEPQPGLTTELQVTAAACRARRSALIYRFAGSNATQALADAGVLAVREPADDTALGSWLASVETLLSTRKPQAEARAPIADRSGDALPPPRYDDSTLTAIAGISSSLACECPRHVAELLMQLASFERYSAHCIDRSPADARLHDDLRRVAGAARLMFEAALERVAQHERLPLRISGTPSRARRKPASVNPEGSPS